MADSILNRSATKSFGKLFTTPVKVAGAVLDTGVEIVDSHINDAKYITMDAVDTAFKVATVATKAAKAGTFMGIKGALGDHAKNYSFNQFSSSNCEELGNALESMINDMVNDKE